jgi:prepilin-type N-terminal cleavage/methylation domain-containing protein
MGELTISRCSLLGYPVRRKKCMTKSLYFQNEIRMKRTENRIKKGFTLIEILIVVVIIAVLAALIIPRFLDQSEKARIAEALTTFGVIKRAAERIYDLGGNSFSLDTSSCRANGNQTWFERLGIRLPLSGNWCYEMNTGDGENLHVYAWPNGAGRPSGSIFFYFNVTNGNVSGWCGTEQYALGEPLWPNLTPYTDECLA